MEHVFQKFPFTSDKKLFYHLATKHFPGKKDHQCRTWRSQPCWIKIWTQVSRQLWCSHKFGKKFTQFNQVERFRFWPLSAGAESDNGAKNRDASKAEADFEHPGNFQVALYIVSPSALIRNHLTEAWRDGNSETPMLSFTRDMLGVFEQKTEGSGFKSRRLLHVYNRWR